MTPSARRVLVGAGFTALLVAATSPAWRLLLLDANPTDEELLQWRCAVRALPPPGRVAPVPRRAPP